jgi:CRISPR-associated endonuclease/helicase Cas3
MAMNNTFVARRRKSDQKEQPVYEHLQEVSAECARLAKKIGAEDAGRLIGLLHDFGKYSNAFQDYITKNTANKRRGEVDHATAGAQQVWQVFKDYNIHGQLTGQILALCLASHHGGLLDCLKPDGKPGFQKRITKDDAETHLMECLEKADKEILDKLLQLDDKGIKLFLSSFWPKLFSLIGSEKESKLIRQFRLGLFTRFLFSCLIDADRISSADFEYPNNAQLRSNGPVHWQTAIERLENKQFQARNEKVDAIRRSISAQCRTRADDKQGIYTLSVPTGGGKTFSSMRFALHHAKKHQLERIIYIIPFTSIIEQNANEVRKTIEQAGDAFPWVLEHHSNLEPEKESEYSALVSENWDAPIIFTTMVQFLEVLFGHGTRSARRLHNLANAVLIFDEIQSLPVNCVHLFCNAVQFLADHAKTTAVLCTATQPLLNKLRCPDKGQLTFSANHELVENTIAVFDQLKRVQIKNQFRSQGWSGEEIAELALKQLAEKGNCLVIVNTKSWARKVYELCAAKTDTKNVFHLSTNLCPAHRKKILAEVRQRLHDKLPVLCISTQLIEAGVDVDFNAVIRFLAGLDSIAQAAGRCNRNGNLQQQGEVFVVNPQEEAIDQLEEIKIGREIAQRIFSEEKENDLLQPEIMTRYFKYYFYERADIMSYPLNEKQVGRDDTLLNLLGDNQFNNKRQDTPLLQQSFKTAGQIFKAIDAPTQAVLVPYDDKGKKIIGELCAAYHPAEAYKLLRQAQQYSVNVFPNVLRRLQAAGAIYPAHEEIEIYCLREKYYNEDFGLSEDGGGRMTLTTA